MGELPEELRRLADGLPENRRRDVEAAIQSSPHLQQQMLEEVRAGRLRKIELLPENATEGGHYDSESKAIRIDQDIFSAEILPTKTQRLDRLVYVFGHETAHSELSGGREKSLRELRSEVNAAIWTQSDLGYADLTASGQKFLDFRRWDESIATVEGWSALASRIEHENGGTITQIEMLKRAESSSYCVESQQVGRLGLADGIRLNQGQRIELDLDPSIRDDRTRLNQSSVLNAVADCHFNLPPKDAKLGADGKSDYANLNGVTLIETIASAVNHFERTTLQDADHVRLNLHGLGLDSKLLESNGLSLGGKDFVLTDTSHGKMRGISLRDSAQPDDDKYRAHEIDTNLSTRLAAPLLSESSHPANLMYAQALSGLRNSPNRPAGTFTQHEEEKLAAGLVAQALTQPGSFPKPHFDAVVMNNDGTKVIGVYGALDSPANRLAAVDIQQTLSVASIEQSSDVARTAMHSLQQQQALAQVQAETIGVDVPTSSGPVMKIGPRTMTPASGPTGDSGGGGDGGGGGGGG
jgi:hypothetical protein